MNIILLESTPNPELTCARAAALCYSPGDCQSVIAKLTEKNDARAFLEKIRSLGHLSIFEHASFTFGIDGISRACSHQLVRHRVASYSQQSQRYVEMSGIEGNLIKQSVFPPTVKAIAQAEQALRRAIAVCEESYIRMVQLGIPAEDARYALPNSTQTNIIVTMNARELMHFFTLRCCERAQWEIRAMATVMLFIAHKVFPVAFNKAGPSCVRGPCSEGSMTCGKIMEVRHKFQIAA